MAVRTPRAKVSMEDEATAICFDHEDPRTGQAVIMQALGTTEGDFLSGILHQLANVPKRGPDLEDALNFMLAVVKGLEPKRSGELCLAVQMAAVHMATMTFAHRLGRVETIPQQDSAERAFNKLAEDLRDADGGSKEIPHRRSAEGHRGTCHGERGRSGDRRLRHARGAG